MRRVPLSQGKVAIVDDEDYELVSKYNWYVIKGRRTFYARANIRLANGKWSTTSMHRVILRAKSGQQIDHKNGNGLDNRRDNLRLATSSQNHGNQEVSSNNTSGYKGVSKFKNLWRARITVNLRERNLGYFKSKEDAARAYDKAAMANFGEFALLNFRR